MPSSTLQELQFEAIQPRRVDLRIADWTEEREKKLRELWAEGLSASQIANELGGVTRNAILGKRMRLGLPQRRAAYEPQSYSPSNRVKQARSARARKKAFERGEIIQFKPQQSRRAEPSSEFRCDVFALNANTCRFPYGSSPYEFCGHPPASGPYCAYHADICMVRT